VPEVDGGVGDGGAGADVLDGDAEVEGDAGFVLGYVGAEELVGDIERAYLLLGDEGAGRGVGFEREGVTGQVQSGGGRNGVGDEAAAGEDSVFDRTLVLSLVE